MDGEVHTLLDCYIFYKSDFIITICACAEASFVLKHKIYTERQKKHYFLITIHMIYKAPNPLCRVLQARREQIDIRTIESTKTGEEYDNQEEAFNKSIFRLLL